MAVTEQSVPTAAKAPTRLQRAKESLSVLWSSKTAMVGLLIVLFWVLVAIFAPLLTPYGPTEQDYTAENQPPSAEHPLGTVVGRGHGNGVFGEWKRFLETAGQHQGTGPPEKKICNLRERCDGRGGRALVPVEASTVDIPTGVTERGPFTRVLGHLQCPLELLRREPSFPLMEPRRRDPHHDARALRQSE